MLRKVDSDSQVFLITSADFVTGREYHMGEGPNGGSMPLVVMAPWYATATEVRDAFLAGCVASTRDELARTVRVTLCDVRGIAGEGA